MDASTTNLYDLGLRPVRPLFTSSRWDPGQLEGRVRADSLASSKVEDFLQLLIESCGIMVVDEAETGDDPDALP